MTSNNITITSTELEAIRSVERWIGGEMQKDFNAPSEPIQDEVATLSRLLYRLAPAATGKAPPTEARPSLPNGEHAPEHPLGQAGPIGIARDHPSHDEGKTSQGPSVIDRGSREIETRWAKEAIGLTAVELNEAYAQFEIGRDGCDIPSPYLHRATARLVEVMRRLGLAEYREIDSPIPF